MNLIRLATIVCMVYIFCLIFLVAAYVSAREDGWKQAGACEQRGGQMWIGWIGNDHMPVCGIIKEIAPEKTP